MTFSELKTAVGKLDASKRDAKDYEVFENSVHELLNEISSIEDISSENESERDRIHCNLWIKLSNSCKDHAAYEDSFQYAEKALAIAEKNNLRTQLANSNFLAGLSKRLQHEYASALEFLQNALSIHEELANKKDSASCLREMGMVHTYSGEYVKALELSTRALSLFEELNDRKMIAVASADIGISYYNVSELSNALEYMSRAVDIFTELGNKQSVATHTGNIGNVYWSLENYPKALEYMKRAIALKEELGDKSGIAYNIANMGRVYSAQADYENALMYTKQALEVFEATKDKKGTTFFTTVLATIYLHVADHEKAFESATRALAFAEQLGDKGLIASNIMHLGQLYGEADFSAYDAAKAEEYMKSAIHQFEQQDDKGNLFVSHSTLSDFYKSQQRWEEALEQYAKYHELEKEVRNEEAIGKAQQLENRRKMEEAERDRQVKLARFQEQEKILHNILPPKIAERVVSGDRRIIEEYQNVSVLFADIVGFTKFTQKVSAEELADTLDEIFSTFDKLTAKHGCEKIKTIGDCYMAVAGLPERSEDHVVRLASLALDMIESIKEFKTKADAKIEVRIGMHCGSVVAGILGQNKYAYDLWGDTVNTASRMESHGEAGRIHVTEEFRNELSQRVIPAQVGIHVIEHGEMEIKGKGLMKTYFLEQL